VGYSLISADEALIKMIRTGYDIDVAVDNEQRPTVIWRPAPDASPFVWFCGIGVAAWSRPI
jgi:hypothetical protein